MCQIATQLSGTRILEGEKEIHYPSGGFIEARTADDPDRLRGGGWNLVIFDECRDIQARTWAEIIRPALMDRRGRALFISTPRGWDWFHGLYLLAERGDPDWAAWRFPSGDNPSIPGDETTPAKLGMSERVYAQEILAEFLPDGGGVLRNVRSVSTLAPEQPERRYSYTFFYDVGRKIDSDAVAGFRRDGEVCKQVYCDRWTGGEWEQSLARLSGLNGYRGTLYVDTSVGDRSADSWLERIRSVVGPALFVEGFRFTQPNKQNMTDSFSLMLETSKVQLLDPKLCENETRNAVEAQILELEAWQAHKLPSGLIRYAGPEGGHDDSAIACITAAHIAGEEVDVAAGWDMIRRAGW